MDLQLKGSRAIVTGSSVGIGEAIARRLAAEGATVIVHGRRAYAVNTVSPGIVVTPGVREFYRLEADRRGWGEDWPAIEAGVLTEVLDNPERAPAERRLADVDPGRLAIAQVTADIADGLGLSSSVVALAWLRARGGVIPILGARTAQQLTDNLTCLDVNLPPDALAGLNQASHIARGFPHDFLASADFILGGLSAQLDLPPGQSAHG